MHGSLQNENQTRSDRPSEAAVGLFFFPKCIHASVEYASPGLDLLSNASAIGIAKGASVIVTFGPKAYRFLAEFGGRASIRCT